ncbi:MAG: transglutaminase family protein [Cyclobacteriaceae bacterium]
MILSIRHLSTYTYAESVFPEPHYLNFYPQQREHLDLKDFQIRIDPSPEGLSVRINSENNLQHQCWFNRSIDEMKIAVEMKVESSAFNPFSFFIEADEELSVLTQQHPSLIPYLNHNEVIDDDLKHWIARHSTIKGDYISWITSLNHDICNEWKHTIRYEANLFSPEECFRAKTGSCRDLSWLLIIALRELGLPARFVSGYAFNPELGEGHELHAWIEVWLPGAGWLGVDPSAGIYTNEAYIPISTSYHPGLTLPVIGKYRGNATSKLETEVIISRID